jgi:hypothetical protein
MSSTNNFSDRLFVTPIDDLYDDNGEQETCTDDSFGNIQGIISGLNVLMQFHENKTDSDGRRERTFLNDDLSTASGSPTEQGVIFVKTEGFLEKPENRKINLRGKRIKLTKFLKTTWKAKLENCKENCLRKLMAKARDVKLVGTQQSSFNVSCFTGKFLKIILYLYIC